MKLKPCYNAVEDEEGGSGCSDHPCEDMEQVRTRQWMKDLETKTTPCLVSKNVCKCWSQFKMPNPISILFLFGNKVKELIKL